MKRAFAFMLMTTTLAAGQGMPLGPAASLHPRFAPGSALTLINDDEDDACEQDDDEGGGDCSIGAAGDAAGARTVAPPNNGLFTDGTAPVVMSN